MKELSIYRSLVGVNQYLAFDNNIAHRIHELHELLLLFQGRIFYLEFVVFRLVFLSDQYFSNLDHFVCVCVYMCVYYTPSKKKRVREREKNLGQTRKLMDHKNKIKRITQINQILYFLPYFFVGFLVPCYYYYYLYNKVPLW